jgi:serine protease Do
VSKEGIVLTNAHVVEGCAEPNLETPAGTMPSRVIARDRTNDLAILKAAPLDRFLSFRVTARLGETVAAFGYPMAGLLSKSGNFTLGNVTALTGLRDDSRFLQVSAAVQPGNSGGPLLDESGNLIGVVTAAFRTVKIPGERGAPKERDCSSQESLLQWRAVLVTGQFRSKWNILLL